MAAFAATASFAQTAYQPSGAVPNPAFKGFVVTGGFDASYQSLKYKGGNQVTTIGHNSTSTSQITFIGVEDLGGGLTADFNFENDIIPTTMYNAGSVTSNGIVVDNAKTLASPSTLTNNSSAQAASTWGVGQVKVGIHSTSLGYLGLGAVNNAALDFNQYSGPFGTAWGSGYGVTQATVGNGYGSSAAKVRYDNSVRYLTPTMNGLTGSLTYRAKNSTAANNMFSTTPGLQAQSGVQELAAIYSQGPLTAIFVNQIDDGAGIAGAATSASTSTLALASTGKYVTNSIGGNYILGKATLYYGYQKMADDGATQAQQKTARYGVKYAVTPVLNVMATSNKRTFGKAGDAADGKATTVMGLGADYMLSKMTAITLRWDKTQDDIGTGLTSTQALSTAGIVGAGFAGTNAASDNTRTRAAVGLRVNF